MTHEMVREWGMLISLYVGLPLVGMAVMMAFVAGIVALINAFCEKTERGD